MTIPDELLMAYVDGELDAPQRAEVERAMAADPQVALRVQRQQALRRQLQGAFEPMLSEPVPERLLAALRAPAKPVTNDNVTQIKPRTHITSSLSQWMALAASLVAGVLITLLATHSTRDDWMTTHNGSLIARGALASALASQPSGVINAPVQLKFSFKTHTGEYCRSFVIRQQHALAGLACREGGEWRVPMLAAVGNETGQYRQAASELPSAIAQWIDSERAGDVLTTEEEHAALRAGWGR